MKHIRATMNRFEREGYKAEILQPPHDEEDDGGAERSLGRLARKEWPPRAHLCRRLLRCCGAGKRGNHGRPRPSGRNRRLREHPALVSLARRELRPAAPWARTQDASDFLTFLDHALPTNRASSDDVGPCALSGIETERAIAPVQAFMQLCSTATAARSFRFRGLREFKEKFATEWEPPFPDLRPGDRADRNRDGPGEGRRTALGPEQAGEADGADRAASGGVESESGAGQAEGPQLLRSSAPEQ